MSRSIPSRLIGGFWVIDASLERLIAIVDERLATRRRTELVFANTNFVVQCDRMRDALSSPDTLIANDGIGINLASLMLYRKRFIANLNGTDFTPRLLSSFKQPQRVFLLGSTPAAVQEAARHWAKLPNVHIVGAIDGFDGMLDEQALLRGLRNARPDVLLLALGNPRQEEWIVAHRDRIDIPLVIGVGALFDFVSGRARRAPRWMQRLHLEWFHRLVQEPRRLIRRYSIDLVRFFAHCLKTRDRDRVAMRRATATR